MTFFQDLHARGLIEQVSDPALDELLERPPLTAYCGFDPTAPSLHVGSLMPLLGLARLQRAGHRPIAVVGGGTGLIGDPSGKTQERQLLGPDQVSANCAGLRDQMARFLAFDGPCAARLVNNADWLQGIGFVEFLRDVGKHFSVNAMIAKESVRVRLEEREQGISFTEFSYMLLQAYDFLWLHENLGCSLQIGGSDQWGNITAGIELIRRKRHAHAFGYTLPLILTSDGKKFGKTEAGTIWLAPERTSPYQLYQYFLNTDDRDVIRFLRYFTFLPAEEIASLERSVREAPEARAAQKQLAREVTAIVHSTDEAQRAEKATAALFVRGQSDLGALIAAALTAGAPSSTIARAALAAEGGLVVANLISDAGVKLVDSRGAARREIASGGIYVNEVRVTDVEQRVTERDLVDGKFLLLRRGKRNQHIVRVDDASTAST